MSNYLAGSSFRESVHCAFPVFDRSGPGTEQATVTTEILLETKMEAIVAFKLSWRRHHHVTCTSGPGGDHKVLRLCVDGGHE